MQLIRPPEGGPKKHGAVGRGPFGQLTMMGLLQMISLGERLKEELDHHPHHTADDDDDPDKHHPFVNKGRLFTPTKPLHPSRVQVMSTDFPRTVQSVQALLTGLFPDAPATEADNNAPIEIDLRHTNTYFIPDPQPRQSPEQLSLETHLSKRPHLLEKEARLKEMAHRVTDELEDHLGEGAMGISFGIGEEKDARSNNDADTDDAASIIRKQPLAWAQMAEILVCLHSRELLPSILSGEDVQAVSDHVAWRWFENLRHPVLAKSSMWRFANRLLENMERKVAEHNHTNHSESSSSTGSTSTDIMIAKGEEADFEEDCIEEPWLCIYSAHDSTLIGLLCVLQLEQPAEWPEYGSALKVELIREEESTADNDGESASLSSSQQPGRVLQHWVRFSLNGQMLRSMWLTDENGNPATMVPLERLVDMIHSEHDLFEDDDESELKYSWKGEMLRELK